MKDISAGARGRSKNSRVIALLGSAGALALTVGGVTLATAPSASAETVTTIPGNPKCETLIPGSTEIKFDDNPKPGSGTGAGVTVIWTQTGDLINFTATGGTVLGAIVKGGPNANFYDYRPGGTIAGVGLHTPVNDNNGKYYGLSHLSFCVGEGTTPTTPPTTEPTTPPTTEPTTPPTTEPTTPPTTEPTTPPTTEPTTPPTTEPTTPPTTEPTTPSETPSTTPSESPTETATPSESPTVSPTSTTSSTPVGVPTDVDAGLSGGMKNASATTSSSQSAWGIALLTLGGLLVFAGVLKARQRRGQHSA